MSFVHDQAKNKGKFNVVWQQTKKKTKDVKPFAIYYMI